MAIADSSGLPVAVHTASASPHEVTLVKVTLESGFVREKPDRLIGDRAYDSDRLDASLQAEGIEMIAPHRKGRKKGPTQDGRKLRRYKRRWAVRLARELLAPGSSLRAAHVELFRVRPPGLHGHPTQVFVRWLLVF
jgi:DDE family transposase